MSKAAVVSDDIINAIQETPDADTGTSKEKEVSETHKSGGGF